MQRRCLLQLPALAVPGLLSAAETPRYRVVSPAPATAPPGMPGRYPGQVVTVRSRRVIEPGSYAVDRARVRAMLDRAMLALTNASGPEEAWRAFISPADRVGIKVNCSGSPKVMSHPAVVGEIARNLVALGVPPGNITIYERFDDQLEAAHYGPHVPAGVRQYAVEIPRRSIRRYDPFTFVEVNFFGEDDTRSNLIRAVSQEFDKIINVPNMKDHGAAGVTGCLKNIAYGNFSNVARSHRNHLTNTKTFIGTLAAVEPLRRKTVLHVMDGLKGVWHGGPFVRNDQFVFLPRRLMVGTDPVAMDRLLLDVIEDERRARGAVSVWERSMNHVSVRPELDPNKNRFVREPGHIAYAAALGLGVYDKALIRHREEDV